MRVARSRISQSPRQSQKSGGSLTNWSHYKLPKIVIRQPGSTDRMLHSVLIYLSSHRFHHNPQALPGLDAGCQISVVDTTIFVTSITLYSLCKIL